MISENEVSQTQFSSNQTSQQNITIKQTEDKNSPQQNLSTTADVSVNRLQIKFQIADEADFYLVLRRFLSSLSTLNDEETFLKRD